jgi:hypothetical protein
MLKRIYFYLSHFFWYLKQSPKRIKNLLKWHAVVWRDHQEDYSKLLEIMEHKFDLQADHWLEMETPRNYKYNKICSSLANKVRTEYYLGELLDYYSADRNLDRFLSDHKRHMKKMYRKVSFGIDQTKTLNEDQKAMLAMDIASYKHRKAKRLLFKIMYHQLENWQ